MSRQNINEVFTIQIPDTFEPMSRGELEQLSAGGGDPYQWGARDRENHIMMVALWKRYSALLAWMSDLKAVAKKNQQLTAKAYAGSGYQFREFLSMQAGESKAEGYRFSYRAGDTAQTAETFLIKEGNMIYAFTCVGREENTAANQAMFRGVMESLMLL